MRNCTGVDDCVNNQCVNGTCLDGHLSYTCTCDAGFTGDFCQTGKCKVSD